MYEKEVDLVTGSIDIRRMLNQCSTDFKLVDVSYRCPTEEWLIDVAGEAYQQTAFDHGLRVYHRDDWDIDDRAMLYCATARGVHRKELWQPSCGLAVGLATYCVMGNPRNSRAICWAIANRLGQAVVVFIDPGDVPELMKLTEKELASLRSFYI